MLRCVESRSTYSSTPRSFRLARFEFEAYFNAGSGNIFGEITGGNIRPLFANSVNAFERQETDLAVPGSGMGVGFQAEIFYEFGSINLVFPGALVFTKVY
ncbi:MAG: hypothetical protein ACKVE4_11025 [Dissulfuribacterales bacterium]